MAKICVFFGGSCFWHAWLHSNMSFQLAGIKFAVLLAVFLLREGRVKDVVFPCTLLNIWKFFFLFSWGLLPAWHNVLKVTGRDAGWHAPFPYSSNRRKALGVPFAVRATFSPSANIKLLTGCKFYLRDIPGNVLTNCFLFGSAACHSS